MNQAQINELLSLGEGQHVEFKSTTKNVDALGRAICGFLNSAGGFLVCGIGDSGDVCGIVDSDVEVSKLERRIHDGLSPKAMVSFQVQKLENRRVLVIEVPEGIDRPYAFRDAIYIREGEVTQKADAEKIRDIVMRHQIKPERWERRFSFADVEKDVDMDEVLMAVQDAQKVRRAFFRKSDQVLMVLEDFSVAKYGKLTNGGDVLFAQNPASRLPQIRIRAMRYNTEKDGEVYRDMKSFEGPLHAVFEDAYTFIVRNTPTQSRFIKGTTKRSDLPIYPEEAIREAIINSLAHRDYSASSGGVSIHIYPRRLVIMNSGSLPEGITADELGKGHISVLRNPDIAHVLYLRGLMEKAGRGSVLMINKCREQGLPVPEWTSDEKLGVTVTFRTPEVEAQVKAQVEAQVEAQVGAQVELDILNVLTASPASSAEIAQALGHKKLSGNIRRVLPHMREAGFLEYSIPDKPKSSLQKYRLTAKGRLLINGVGAREKV